MKRYNDLFDKMVALENINYIYNTQVRKNTKNKTKIYKFEEYYTLNITNVKRLMEDEKYTPSRYNIFLIREPKYRAILSQNITDKLINHVVANVLVEVLEPSLINNNIATRKNKGTHYGIKLLKKYLNQLKGKGYICFKV